MRLDSTRSKVKLAHDAAPATQGARPTAKGGTPGNTAEMPPLRGSSGPRPPSDLAGDLKAVARTATDPTAARILDAASNAVRQSGVPQLRVAGDTSWGSNVSGTFKRRLNPTDGKVTCTFLATGAGESRPITIEPAIAEGIANNSIVTMSRDGAIYTASNLAEVRASGMLARVEQRGGNWYAVGTTPVSPYRELPLRDGSGLAVGDTFMADVSIDANGKPFATPNPDPRWQKLTPERIAALKIAIDEAGIDVAIPAAVRDEVTQVIASKPTTVEALAAAGYKDLTCVEFYTTDNPDREGGTPTKDFDQAVALQPREGGGFVVYRALADPGYFIDLFPEDGNRGPSATRALKQTLTTYFQPDDAPIYDPRFSEGKMSLNAHEVRPSFVVKMEVDANGRLVSTETGEPKIEIINAAINVRHNGSYWAAHNYLESGATEDMPPAYRAFWDQAKKLADIAGIKPHDGDELDSQAIESYFSKLANGAIGGEIDRQLKANGLFNPNGAKYMSRYQEPPDAQRINAYFAMCKALGVRPPPAPPVASLARGVTPNDDRWSALVAALELTDSAPVSQVFDRLGEVARDSKHALAGAVTEALWTPREEIRAMIAESADDPILQELLSYNYIRKLRRAVLSSTAEGHYDVGMRRYGWVTAPMRRTSDAVNMALWRALNGGDRERATRILGELPQIARRNEANAKQGDYVRRELEAIDTANKLAPYAGKGELFGTVRFIGMEGVEVALQNPHVNVTVPIKWMTKRLGEAPKAIDGGVALASRDRDIVRLGEAVHVRIDLADPAKRKVLVDLAELDAPR